LLISPWTITEFSSALALKERVSSISRQERRAALTMFEKFRSLRLALVPLEAADFEAAARLCDAGAAPLRAGDALHRLPSSGRNGREDANCAEGRVSCVWHC
jgi:hypothetical protein